MPAYLRAQSNKKISILTWNIADQEALFKEEFDDFGEANPGVEIEWLDKKGPDLPASIRPSWWPERRLTSSIFRVRVGRMGCERRPARSDALLQNDPAFVKLFNPDYMSGFVYEKKNYLVPFYVAKTLLFYNKLMFKEAGLSAPPKSLDELLAFAGDGERREDRLPHAELRLAVLAAHEDERHDLLTPDLRKPAFNTPAAAEPL